MRQNENFRTGSHFFFLKKSLSIYQLPHFKTMTQINPKDYCCCGIFKTHRSSCYLLNMFHCVFLNLLYMICDYCDDTNYTSTLCTLDFEKHFNFSTMQKQLLDRRINLKYKLYSETASS